MSSVRFIWTGRKNVGKMIAMATKARKPRSRPPTTLGEVLTAARKKFDPMPSYETIARNLSIEVSHWTVSKYHTDVVQVPDVEIIQALIDLYGLTLADLPADVRERCERLRDRLIAASSRVVRPGLEPGTCGSRPYPPEPYVTARQVA